MRMVICDCCGRTINEDLTDEGSVYQFSMHCISPIPGTNFASGSAPHIKPIELCYDCAAVASKSVERWLLNNMNRRGM